MSPEDIAHDIRRVIARMKMKIESAEMHLKAGTSPLTVSFILWSEMRKCEATLKAHDPKPNEDAVQWWVADLDQHGNPKLTDGAHDDREGCEKALYIMARLGLRPEQQRAICRVEIYPPEAKAHDANEDALKTLNAIGLGRNG